MCLGGGGYAQNRAVTGNVVDKENNHPLAGAIIYITGTKNGTTTNSNGLFSLTAPESAMQITVSFMGYETKTLDITPNMSVALVSAANTMEDLVISGYSMVKRKDLTGSIGVLKSDDNFSVGKTDAQQALQGRLAGVNVTRSDGAPGGGVSVQIRGTNTLYGTTEPLYVVDGIPMAVSNQRGLNSGNDVATSNSLAFLDPNDIESMEVLKDASSIALYGSRGVNGVIIITTKSGKSLASQDRVNISYNTSVSNVANKMEMLSSQEYAQYVNASKMNTSILNGSTSPWPGGVPYSGSWDEATQRYNDKPSDFPLNDRHYWQDQVLQTAISHDLSLDLSGSGKGYDYSLSGGLTDQQGVVKNSSFKRYTTKINFNKEIKPWLKIGTSTNVSFTKSNMLKNSTDNWNNGDEGVIRSALYFPPTYKADDPRLLNDELNALASNPLVYTTPLNETRGYTAYTSNYANINIMKGLVFRTVLGYSFSGAEQNQYYGVKLWEGRPPKNGLDVRGSNTWGGLVFDNLLMYNRDFGKHNVSATAATSYEQTRSYWEWEKKSGFGSDADQGWQIQAGNKFEDAQSGLSESSLVSGIFRAAYNYDSKYFVTLTGRYDSSSKFRPGRRGAFFPSAGVAYTVTREEFMKPVASVVNNLKVRFSYGNTGNQGIGSYATFALMNPGSYNFGSTDTNGYGLDPYNPGNIYLTWETTTQADLGFDIGLFRRVDLTVDLYHKNTKNVLQPRQPAPSTGLKALMDNIGNITNRGIELTLNANIIDKGKDRLKWDIGGTFSANQNKITHLGFGDFAPNVAYGGNDKAFLNAEGRPIGQLYGYVYDGIWNSREDVINSAQFQNLYPGYSLTDNTQATEMLIKQKWIGEIRYKDLDEDDSITEKDKTWLGNTNPKFIYGITTTLNYKGFDLYILMQGVYGNMILNQPAQRFYDSGSSRNTTVAALNRAWSPQNPSGDLPKLYEDYARTFRTSALYIEDGSYFKLRTVSLGYTFRNIKWVNLLRLYVSGNNLLTATKYSGFDPEVNSFDSSPSIRGIDAGGYPHARSFIFGVNVNF
ncbi:SusC/RagA family TonB-linked outer membrane protein [Bacteroidia bacterium]|nr:SusC/RagA family TonB-linked outer membrane protein [Bacteroidia bacterium]